MEKNKNKGNEVYQKYYVTLRRHVMRKQSVLLISLTCKDNHFKKIIPVMTDAA